MKALRAGLKGSGFLISALIQKKFECEAWGSTRDKHSVSRAGGC